MNDTHSADCKECAKLELEALAGYKQAFRNVGSPRAERQLPTGAVAKTEEQFKKAWEAYLWNITRLHHSLTGHEDVRRQLAFTLMVALNVAEVARLNIFEGC